LIDQLLAGLNGAGGELAPGKLKAAIAVGLL
jgi:hypothetical protein